MEGTLGLVEDDQIQRERVRGWLEGQQWIVGEAENGRQALARLQEDKPDEVAESIRDFLAA